MDNHFCPLCREKIPEGHMSCPHCEKRENRLPEYKRKKPTIEDPFYEPSRYRRNQKYGRKK